MRWIDIKVKDLKTKINDQCVTDAKEELIVENGYEIVNMDISYVYEVEFVEQNPNFVWLNHTRS